MALRSGSCLAALLCLAVFQVTPIWAQAPSKERLAIGPFENQGGLAPTGLSGSAIRDGLAAELEARFGLEVSRLRAEEKPVGRFQDPNTQLLPPAYRMGVGSALTLIRRERNWTDQAKRERAGVLVIGSYEVLGGELRLIAEIQDPWSGKGLASVMIQGSTEARFVLEGKLAEGIAESLRPPTPPATGEPQPPSPEPEPEKPLEETETAEGHYENGFALTRRYDQTQDVKYLEGAKEEYRTALALDPNHFRSLNNLGTVLHRLGQYDEAIAYYQKVLELNPRYARAMENAALAYKALGNDPEAGTMWRRALEHEERAEVRAAIEETLKGLETGGN